MVVELTGKVVAVFGQRRLFYCAVNVMERESPFGHGPRAFHWVDLSVSEAIKLIVEGYLTLKDRQSLEGLRAHRQRLRERLQDRPKSWVDVDSTARLLDDDLRVIEAAIARF
jgi:hypothetical protein